MLFSSKVISLFYEFMLESEQVFHSKLNALCYAIQRGCFGHEEITHSILIKYFSFVFSTGFRVWPMCVCNKYTIEIINVKEAESIMRGPKQNTYY